MPIWSAGLGLNLQLSAVGDRGFQTVVQGSNAQLGVILTGLNLRVAAEQFVGHIQRRHDRNTIHAYYLAAGADALHLLAQVLGSAK